MPTAPVLPPPVMFIMLETPFAMRISLMPIMAMPPVVAPAATLHIERSILMRIPVIFNKIDRHPTRVVAMTVLVPMPGMAGWNAQIDRWPRRVYTLNHDGLGIDERRRGVTSDVEPAIKSGMANIHRDAYISSCCRQGKSSDAQCCTHKKSFHVIISRLRVLD